MNPGILITSILASNTRLAMFAAVLSACLIWSRIAISTESPQPNSTPLASSGSG